METNGISKTTYAYSDVPEDVCIRRNLVIHFFQVSQYLFIHRKETDYENYLLNMSYSSSIDFTLRLKVAGSIHNEVTGFFN
jgi:hypothetical protein